MSREFPAAAYDRWKTTEPDDWQNGLSEQRCPQCGCIVPVSTIVQHALAGQICEDCADELEAEREHDNEQ